MVDTHDDKLASSEEDKSALQKRAHDEFINETERISNHDGTSRYKIKLTRLPEHLYPNKVDGLKISGTAINRFISLENRLQHPRNAKLRSGVHERVNDLIQDGMMKEVGLWEEHKNEFLQDQAPGREKLILPWQMVVDENKATEHSKIRMCLDGTAANKLIYKIKSDMPEIMDILMRWKTSNFWCTVDIRKMFWSILTHQEDAELQYCVWRTSPKAPLNLYLFRRMVMGLNNSPGLARLTLLKNAADNKAKYPSVQEIIRKDTYMDDSVINGATVKDVINKTTETIACLKQGSFEAGKILTDNQKIIEALPKESLHPSIIEAIENKSDTCNHVLGVPIEYGHPNMNDVVIENTKQLGIHISLDLKEETCYLTYNHWHNPKDTTKKEVLTKRMVARCFATAWNPLQEMGPLTNPGKVCLSKIWKLQTHLQRRQEQMRFDLKEKKELPTLGKPQKSKQTNKMGRVTKELASSVLGQQSQ